MQYLEKLRATVLVYTMVLVVIGVFMATVVLNIAVQLSVEYDLRNIEISIWEIIKTKWDLTIKYAKDVNQTWDGFRDILSCPENITLSWSTIRTTWVDTELRFIDDTIVCHVNSAHSGNDLDIFFNSDYTDLEFAELWSSQVAINSWSLAWNFPDSDSTNISLANNWYFSPDGIDDNFDSDNNNIFSSWSLNYPDWYLDNDADARLLQYWYILEWSGFYNIFWSNSKIKKYIWDNSNNLDGINEILWDSSSTYLWIDANMDHAMYLYEIDKDIYDLSSELVVKSLLTWTGQTWWVWYIQNDLSISPDDSNAYDFDFSSNDYAIFIENTSSWALLYQLRAESWVTWSAVYINPLKDDDATILSHLWSHVFIDDEGKLIWDMLETFGLKSNDSAIPSGSNLWLDASKPSTIVRSSDKVSLWKDLSRSNNHAWQGVSWDRPELAVAQLNWLNTMSFTEDYFELSKDQNIRTAFFVVDNADGSNTANVVSSLLWSKNNSGYSYTFLNTNTSDSNYDISVDWNVWDSAIVYFQGNNGVAWWNINLSLTNNQVEWPGIWAIVFDDSIPNNYIGWLTNGTFYKSNINLWEVITYDRALNVSELNQVWEYLSDKWGISWISIP